MELSSQEEYVAFLEARIEALEEALRRRSRVLRIIQREVCTDDLLQISRIQAGLPPLPRQAYDVALWPETVNLTAADVVHLQTELVPHAMRVERPSQGPLKGLVCVDLQKTVLAEQLTDAAEGRLVDFDVGPAWAHFVHESRL